MKNFVCLLPFVIVSWFTVTGQSKFPPAFEIKADTAEYVSFPDENWQLLEDPTNKLSINQVSSSAFDNKFHVNNTKTKGYDYNILTFWARYAIKNTMAYPVSITIPEGVGHAELYILQANKTWKTLLSGWLVPWDKRDGLKRINELVYTIAPGQTITLYEKDIEDYRVYKPKSFAVSIGFKDNVVKYNYIENDARDNTNVTVSIIFGMLLMAGFINLLFFRIVREKTYLYFALFLLSYGFYLFLHQTYIVFHDHWYVNHYLTLFCLIYSFYTLMHFARHYLSTKAYTPRWDKFLVVLCLLQVATWMFIGFMPVTLSYKAYIITNALTGIIVYCYMPVILFTMLYYYFKYNTGRMGIIAILPGLVWFGLGYTYLFISKVLNQFYKVPYSKLFNWLTGLDQIAILFIFLWLVIGFSWILFNRYRDMQQNMARVSLDREIERNLLIAKQNQELETQVAARTAELRNANHELSEQQEEITAQRDRLSETVEELKATQTQLIQSEKMASLGELTAGIAHEIQNPLNFVNNFSEVNMELTVEMKDEIQKGNTADAAALADDIEQNLEKIIHHGKRADAIVKNMLLHSRNNTAEKQLTDINALADEYLRLSYHGLRAKDKSFNSGMVTYFDDNLPKVNIIQQDMGRVLLNLFNNAFYTVNQKKNTRGADYKPEVSVTTSIENGQVIIKIKDNGNGISDAIKDKIMQPFFTTKPTGEGTGLGLSLSYDIVMKGHGGSISVNTKEGEFTEFIVTLPLK